MRVDDSEDSEHEFDEKTYHELYSPENLVFKVSSGSPSECPSGSD